jgi:ribosomal protein L35AE/L33A
MMRLPKGDAALYKQKDRIVIIINFLNLYSGFKAKSCLAGSVIWIKKSTGKILVS